MNAMNQNLLQLSVENHSEPGVQGPNRLTCAILDFDGGYLRDGSDATDTCLSAPYDEHISKASWYLQPDADLDNASFTIVIFSTDNPDFPACPIKVKAKDVLRWCQQGNSNGRKAEEQQVYRKGRYAISGSASIGAQGPVYTITAS